MTYPNAKPKMPTMPKDGNKLRKTMGFKAGEKPSLKDIMSRKSGC